MGTPHNENSLTDIMARTRLRNGNAAMKTVRFNEAKPFSAQNPPAWLLASTRSRGGILVSIHLITIHLFPQVLFSLFVVKVTSI